MAYSKESDFEEALIKILSEKGWEKAVLKNYTEQQLIQNWADILFENNRSIDRLNDYPLTNGEMQQIIEQQTGHSIPFDHPNLQQQPSSPELISQLNILPRA